MKKYNIKNYIRYKEDLKKCMPITKFYDYCTTNELITKSEQSQNRIGRQILKENGSFNGAAIRTDLG